MLRAISSASATTRLALMPDAGSSSYIVTTGPGRTSTIDPLTLKSSSTLSSSRALRSSAALSIVVLPVAGAALDRKSVVEGKSGSVRVNLGVRRILKQKKQE